ncbi:MAG: xylulokinase [Johnsonella sp.]|nr:xylulokinase [Johnsonella sp.]
MSKVLLGIDIGTSSCKTALFNEEGKLLSSASSAYLVYYPKAGYAQQDPVDWWKAVCRSTKEVLDKSGVNAGDIIGIGVDGQSWSAIPLDRQGDVLCPTPIWMDTRAEEICARLREQIGEEVLFEVSGNPLKPSYTMPKVLWYKEESPEIYNKTDKILQSNSYIVYRLTGKITQDLSQGYGWSCFNMREGKWDRELCRELGIEDSFLPEIHPCHQVVGNVSRKAAQETGLCEGTPVVAGALDAACATLGAGVVKPGQTQEQGGQAGGMSICMDSYKADRNLILGFHASSDRWLLQGGTVGGAGVMKWFEKEFAAEERMQSDSFEALNDLAKKIPPGSEGVVFLPYMAGERTPIWDPYAKGVFYGLDFSKSRGHFLRAAMEGVAFSLRHNIETAEAAGACVDVLRAVGGAANSALWMQIKADITGKAICVPSSDTATTLGAVLLAGVGVRLYKDFEDAVGRTIRDRAYYEPDPKNREIYDRNYEIYRELYESLKKLMRRSGKEE